MNEIALTVDLPGQEKTEDVASLIASTFDGFKKIIGVRQTLANTPPQDVKQLEAMVDGMKSLLLYKNEKYGNAVLHPLGVFTVNIPHIEPRLASALVRLDDKLSRVQNAENLRPNDLSDLIGYTTLLSIGLNSYGQVCPICHGEKYLVEGVACEGCGGTGHNGYMDVADTDYLPFSCPSKDRVRIFEKHGESLGDPALCARMDGDLTMVKVGKNLSGVVLGDIVETLFLMLHKLGYNNFDQFKD